MGYISAHLGLPPNFLYSSYFTEASRDRDENDPLPEEISVPYSANALKGTVQVSWYDNPCIVSHIRVSIEDEQDNPEQPDPNPQCLIITSTSVTHVIREGAGCSLWFHPDRDEDGECYVEICCDDWKKCLDASKPMVSFEKKEFVTLDLVPSSVTLKPTILCLQNTKKQVGILRKMLTDKSKAIEDLKRKIKMMEKLVNTHGRESHARELVVKPEPAVNLELDTEPSTIKSELDAEPLIIKPEPDTEPLVVKLQPHTEHVPVIKREPEDNEDRDEEADRNENGKRPRLA